MISLSDRFELNFQNTLSSAQTFNLNRNPKREDNIATAIVFDYKTLMEILDRAPPA